MNVGRRYCSRSRANTSQDASLRCLVPINLPDLRKVFTIRGLLTEHSEIVLGHVEATVALKLALHHGYKLLIVSDENELEVLLLRTGFHELSERLCQALLVVVVEVDGRFVDLLARVQRVAVPGRVVRAGAGAVVLSGRGARSAFHRGRFCPQHETATQHRAGVSAHGRAVHLHPVAIDDFDVLPGRHPLAGHALFAGGIAGEPGLAP